MNSDWEVLELGEIVENKSRRFNFDNYNDVVFINTGDVLEGKFLHNDLISKIGLPGQAKKAIKKGDILFSEIRPANKRYARVDFDADNYVVSTKFMVLSQFNQEIDKDYFYLVITSNQYLNQFQRIAESRSGTFPQITFNAISYLPIPKPPLTEQRFLADIIGALDDKIDLNRQMNTTLEAMAQALFKSWFVDFDPVLDNALAQGNKIPEALKAKAERRKAVPETKKLIHTNPELAALFPASFVFNETLDTWIPEGWGVKTIDDIATVVGGGTPSTKKDEYYTENGIAWLSPKDLSGYEWKFIDRGERDITELGLVKSSAKLMPKGTVLFSSRAPIGYIAIAENDICTNQGFKSFVPDKGIPTDYLYGLLRNNIEKIESVATGSTFKEVSGSALKGIAVVVPEEKVITAFSKLMEPNNQKMQVLRRQSNILTKTRDTLLPQLISGRVRVKC